MISGPGPYHQKGYAKVISIRCLHVAVDVVVNNDRWIFCMRRASWWRSIGTHTWTRCPKRSVGRSDPWWGHKDDDIGCCLMAIFDSF